ncbi:MAG: hypothetical protein RBQ88_03970 [Desulfobulbus oligotrophicus]|jgi:hypothetical protein|nr:hypothetical protein [Desulfobulbus oligotrophicus]
MLCFMGHVLMENRNGLAVNTRVTQATETTERETALSISSDVLGTLVDDLRSLTTAPACGAKSKSSAIDDRTTRHEGYAVSRKKRKRVEEIFGWMKTVVWLRKAGYKGEKKIGRLFTPAAGVRAPLWLSTH